jgi:hypothetical protein
MKIAENLDALGLHPIGRDERRACDHQLPRARDASGTTNVRRRNPEPCPAWPRFIASRLALA